MANGLASQAVRLSATVLAFDIAEQQSQVTQCPLAWFDARKVSCKAFTNRIEFGRPLSQRPVVLR